MRKVTKSWWNVELGLRTAKTLEAFQQVKKEKTEASWFENKSSFSEFIERVRRIRWEWTKVFLESMEGTNDAAIFRMVLSR